MTISVNYQKRKNTNLFNQFQTNKNINLTNVQNYIPIYDRFFSLNNTNWNAINLNHQWSISDIKDSKKRRMMMKTNMFLLVNLKILTMTMISRQHKMFLSKWPHS